MPTFLLPMKPIIDLPDNYIRIDTLDLSRDIGILIKMQIAVLLSFIPLGWFFLWVTFALRPDAGEVLPQWGLFDLTISNGFSVQISATMQIALSLLIAVVLLIVIHEGIHGLFFYLFTGRRPRFGFKILYAYAASPEGVYITRGQYFLVGLSPLVIMTIIGLCLIPILPLFTLPSLVFILILNTSGSVGDIVMMAWLLRQPKDALIRDTGIMVTAFGPGD
jgi:hypothetical protein